MEKMVVHIMRGISGAGKSTYVKRHFPDAVVCSADKYFDRDGTYQFNPRDLPRAHAACKARFVQALEDGVPEIVVDNTNTQLWEFQEYVELAKEAGYDVDVVRLVVSPKEASERNVHGVPMAAIAKMQARFEDYPSERKVKTSS